MLLLPIVVVVVVVLLLLLFILLLSPFPWVSSLPFPFNNRQYSVPLLSLTTNMVLYSPLTTDTYSVPR